MIPSFGSFVNSGTLPFQGGSARSGNGDSTFNNESEFGGLRINNGIDPNFVIVGAIVLIVILRL